MDRSHELINPFVSETTEAACIWMGICICITVVIDIIMAIQQMNSIFFMPKTLYKNEITDCINSQIE